ncbi:MAG TPA: SCO family protein [Oscillatoriaceae cyanobacterium]
MFPSRLTTALALALLLGACAQSASTDKPQFPHAAITPAPVAVPALSLENTAGKLTSLDQFKGKWVWLYMGYTSCPDVCPAAMSYLAHEYKLLKNPILVQGVFVSVDPKRDTPKKLGEWAHFYDAHFVGLTGDKTTIAAIAKPLGFGYSFDPPDKTGFYGVEHTNLVFVLDPQGRYVATYVPGDQPGMMAQDFNALTKEKAS